MCLPSELSIGKKRDKVSFVGESLFSFFDEGELDTLGGEETDDGFLSFSNDEDVADSCGEGVTLGVLDMGNIEGTWMLFDMLEDTDSTDVVTTVDQN
jgi:hypothetical protein